MVIVALASKGQLFNQVVSASVVGPEVGDCVGAEVVGDSVGAEVVGDCVGLEVGDSVEAEVGDCVGAAVAQTCFTFAITDTSVDHESTSVGHP